MSQACIAISSGLSDGLDTEIGRLERFLREFTLGDENH